MDRTIEWYETFTPLELLDRREDAEGQGAWLGHPDQGDKPFILVLVSFVRDQHKGPLPTMAPFAHIGIEMPSKEMVDAIAARGQGRVLVVARRDARSDRLRVRTHRPTAMWSVSYDQGVYEKPEVGLGPGYAAERCVSYLSAFATGVRLRRRPRRDDFVTSNRGAGDGCTGRESTPVGCRLFRSMTG